MTVINLKNGNEIKITDGMTLSCALGNFDGVHRGHTALLKKATEKGTCTHSAVWTFRRHPRLCSGDESFSALTTTEQRLSLFAGAGIDLAVLCDFPDVKDVSPEDFALRILYNECHVRRAVCGYNFRYGKNASGTPTALSEELKALGAEEITVDAVKSADGAVISSSAIRRFLEEGDIERANDFLGREFCISLPVSEGQRLGRTLGLPTVNQVFPPHLVIPRHGVYAAKCTVDGKEYKAIANIGVRPTVISHAENVNCETHIIGFSGDLYEKTVPVRLCRFLRDEKKFSSVDELKSAILADEERAVRLLFDEE